MSLSTGAEWLSALGAAGLPVLADAAIKGSAILAVACIASVFVRRASAATRHAIWFLAMVSLLVLPVLSLVLPGWHVLPAWVNVAETVVPPVPHASAALAVPESAVPAPPRDMPLPADGNPLDIVDHGAGRPPASAGRSAPSVAAGVPRAEPPPWWSAASLRAWVGLTWALGAAVTMAPVILGAFSLWRLGRSARRVTAGPRWDLLTRLSALLGLRRHVVLLESGRRAMPMAWGLVRPRLLIPAEAERWPPGCLCAVLLHELAHVKRWDCLTQLVMRIACGLYWFNPLAWVAFRCAVAEHERACDDVVLAAGGKPSEYAEYLLDVASRLPGRRLTLGVAIALARPSRLEGRLLAILDRKRSRRAVTRAAMLGAIFALVAVLVPLAVMRPTVQASQAAAEATAGSSSVADEVVWSEALNGLRVRLTAPSGAVYRRQAPLPLLVEVQNVSDKPIPFSRFSPEFRILATDAKGARMGIPRRIPELNPWEGRTDSLAPGDIVRSTVWFDRLRFIKPVQPGSSLDLKVSAPTQLEVPGSLPKEIYSPPVTIQVQDELPSPPGETDLTGEWTAAMDLTFWEYTGLRGHRAMHIDGRGRVTMLSRMRGNDDGPMPDGRTEVILDKQRLDRLARLLRDQQVWRLAAVKRGIASPDEGEIRLSLSIGAATLVGDYPLHVAKDQPSLMALRTEMHSLVADAVAVAAASTDRAVHGVGNVPEDARTLDLRGKKVTDADLRELKGFQALEELYLSGNGITDAGLKELADFRNLRALNLMCARGVTDAGMKELKGCTGLRELHLVNTGVSDAGLAELKGLDALGVLYLSGPKITDAGLSVLKEFKGLREVCLLGPSFTDAGLKELKDLKGLRALHLRSAGITNAGLRELKGFTGLQVLSLPDTNITDAGLKELKALTGLRELDLRYTKATDAGMRDVAGLKALESLDLTYTNVTDAGLKELEGLKGLRELHCVGAAVTEAGVERLRKALPQAKITAGEGAGARPTLDPAAKSGEPDSGASPGPAARAAPDSAATPEEPAPEPAPPDEILKQLGTILELEERILAGAQEQFRVGRGSEEDVGRQQVKVIDAMVRLIERKAELAARPKGDPRPPAPPPSAALAAEIRKHVATAVAQEEALLALVQERYRVGRATAEEVDRQQVSLAEAKVRLARLPAETAAARGIASDRSGPAVPTAQVELLPGSGTPLEKALAEGYAFVALCEAADEAALMDKVTGVQEYATYYQTLTVVEVLAGQKPADGVKGFHYTPFMWRGEHAVNKGQRVVWIVRQVQERFRGIKALEDTPENRRAIAEAAGVAIKPPVPPAPPPRPAATPILKVRSTDGVAVADVHDGVVRVRLGGKTVEGPTIIISPGPVAAGAPRRGIALTVRDGAVRMSADGNETLGAQITIHPDGRVEASSREATDASPKAPAPAGPDEVRPVEPGRAEAGDAPPAGSDAMHADRQVFPLTYREADESDGPVRGNTFHHCLPGRPAEAKAVPADLSGQALYFLLPTGGRMVLAVLDPSPSPRLFVDVAGTGDLAAAEPLPATPWGPLKQFGPVAIPVGGQAGRVARVRFLSSLEKNDKDIAVAPAGYVAGEVNLDGQTYRVALVDHNLSGRYDNALRGDGSPDSEAAHTYLAIDLNQDGRLGPPGADAGETFDLLPALHVGSAYYSVRVAPDGSSIALAKTKPDFGTLDTGCADLSLALVGEYGSRTLSGSGGKWQVPAGWHAATGATLNRSDGAGILWSLHGVSSWGRLARFDIRTGETLSLRAGPPLSVKVHPSGLQPNGMIHFALALEGQAGENYNAAPTRGGVPQPPRFRVLDEAGKTLGTGVFNAGSERTYSWCWWRVPEGFKGKYRVEVEGDFGPFEIAWGGRILRRRQSARAGTSLPRSPT